MTDINNLFFDLIRVAIGNQVCLSHTPSASEWGELYAMAKKQSLVGVCFAGVQKLVSQQQAPPEMLYLQWMGMAAKIQQRNEVVNRQCSEVYRMLKADGFNSCILKGQSVARYYGCLSELRQSGDIDVWVGASDTKIINWSYSKCGKTTHDYHHIDSDLFPDTQVELHFRPTLSRNVLRDLKIQKWSKGYTGQFVYDEKVGFTVLPLEFDVTFILHHIYWHVMYGGCGFRQLMDFYFVVMAANEEELYVSKRDIERLSIMRFASAIMYILEKIFILPKDKMFIEPDIRLGKVMLGEFIKSGNMGHHDKRKMDFGQSKLGYLLHDTFYGLRLFRHFPIDVLCIPFGMIYISLKGKIISRKLKRLDK